MKKILLLLSVFVLFSCEQEDLSNLVDNSKVETGQQSAVKGRAASTIADFNPIDELKDIPVNIINVGNTKNKYLSCVEKGSKVDLYNKDDGSMRQRWYVKSKNVGGSVILLVGGNSSFPSVYPYNVIFVTPDYASAPDMSPMLMAGLPTQMDFLQECNNYYKIKNAEFLGMNYPIGYLQSETTTDTSLKFKANNSSLLAQWELVPVGEYKIVSIDYEETSGDFINRKDQKIDGAIIPNTSPTENVEHTISITSSVREKSNFTESQGVSTQKNSSLGFNLGINLKKVNIGINGHIDNSTASSQTVTYGEEKEHSVSVVQTFKINIPPMQTYRIEVLKMSYDASVTYVATLEKCDGEDKGKRFRIKGKWEGIVTTYLYYKLYTMPDNIFKNEHII